MNIPNISALAKQLENLGFGDLGYPLLKRICFKPSHFSIIQKIEKGNDQLSFEMHFEKRGSDGEYTMVYYDAILQPEIILNTEPVNRVNIPSLEKQMSDVDWKKAFNLTERKPWHDDNKSSWEQEQKIEMIINELAQLESTEEGKLLSSTLKFKYWNGTAYDELFDNISSGKNKAEISQRFFFFEDQAGISVDEACRFLQNRRMEKQMQAKRKQQESQPDEPAENDGNGTSGSGLLKKKRITSPIRKGKSKSSVQ